MKTRIFTLDVGSGSNPKDIARGNISLDLVKRPGNKPNNFVCGDAHNLPFKDSVFDKVFFCEVIEHIENPSKCLTEIHRVLLPNGLLFLSTPNMYFWRIVLRELRGKHSILGGTGHIAAFTASEIINLLSRIGFADVQIDYETWIFMRTHCLDKVIKRLLPKNMTEQNTLATCRKRGQGSVDISGAKDR